MPTAIPLDSAVSRIATDGVITRRELANTARLANSKKDPSGLAAKLVPERDKMTGNAADAFDAFNANVAANPGDALLKLRKPSLSAPPPGTPKTSPLAVRLSAASATTEQGLVERRAMYQTLIDAHTTTIKTLETQVADINARISTKTTQAQDLINEESRLIKEIEDKRAIAASIGVYSGIVGFFTLGVGAVIGGAAAAAALAAIATFQSDLNSVRANKARNQSELNALQASQQAFQQRQNELNARLNELKGAQAELEVARAVPVKTVPQLQKAADTDSKLVANLSAQIVVLTAMRANAQGYEAALDTMIRGLKDEVTQLENQLARTNASIVFALVDVALTGFAVSKALKLEGITLGRKQLLLAGFDLVHGDPTSLASTVVNGLVGGGVVAAGGGPVLSAALTSLLSSATGTSSSAAVTALAANTGGAALTAVQQRVLDTLAKETRFDVEPVAKAVVAAPSLDDDQASALLALLGA